MFTAARLAYFGHTCCLVAYWSDSASTTVQPNCCFMYFEASWEEGGLPMANTLRTATEESGVLESVRM